MKINFVKKSATVFAAAVVFTGCSYSGFEKKIVAERDGLVTVTDTSGEVWTDTQGEPVYVATAPVEVPPLSDEDIVYTPVGERFAAWYDDGSEEYAEWARQNDPAGVYFTVDNVSVYDTLEESGLLSSEPNLDDDEFIDTLSETSYFVFVDLSGYYENQTGNSDNDEIRYMLNWKPSVNIGELDESDKQIRYPYYFCYFSEHPQKGDIDPKTGEEFNIISDYTVFRSQLKSGEEFDFSIGFFADKTLVDNKKIFLSCRAQRSPSEGSDPLNYIDLFGGHSDDSE